MLMLMKVKRCGLRHRGVSSQRGIVLCLNKYTVGLAGAMSVVSMAHAVAFRGVPSRLLGGEAYRNLEGKIRQQESMASGAIAERRQGGDRLGHLGESLEGQRPCSTGRLFWKGGSQAPGVPKAKLGIQVGGWGSVPQRGSRAEE